MDEDGLQVGFIILLLILVLCFAPIHERFGGGHGGGGRGGGGFGGRGGYDGRGGYESIYQDRGEIGQNTPPYDDSDVRLLPASDRPYPPASRPNFYGGFGRRYRPGGKSLAYNDVPWFYNWYPMNDYSVSLYDTYDEDIVSMNEVDTSPNYRTTISLNRDGTWIRTVNGGLDDAGTISTEQAKSLLKLTDQEPESMSATASPTIAVTLTRANGDTSTKMVSKSALPDNLRS